MLYFCKVGDTMESRCPRCNAVLNYVDNKFKCEYCRTEFDNDYFTDNKAVDYIIPFKITKDDAIKIYKKNIKSSLLTPSIFTNKKNIEKIEGIYVPCYIYDLDCTGVVEFECEKISFWKSSGIKYKKTDIYKAIRSANMCIKNMPIISTLHLQDSIFNNIEPYNYNELVVYDNCYLESYKLYPSNKTKDELLDSIQIKAKDSFVSEIKKDIKDYDSIKQIDNSINLYNSNRKYTLLPIWLLKIDYNNKEKIYIINGQTGTFSGNIPINKKRCILIWIIVFVIIFIILLLLNLIRVII